jgi:dihydroxy-acid dehydratase
MPKNNIRSRTITHGIERAPNRAMLRAVGFSDSDFDKPIVAFASGYSTITPSQHGPERAHRPSVFSSFAL